MTRGNKSATKTERHPTKKGKARSKCLSMSWRDIPDVIIKMTSHNHNVILYALCHSGFFPNGCVLMKRRWWQSPTATWTTDTRWEFFSKYPKYFGQLGRSAKSIVMYFRVFCVVYSTNYLLKFSPSAFIMTQPFFQQKAKIFMHF